MSFGSPLVLLALLALAPLGWLYARGQRGREQTARAFVSRALEPSVVSRRPGLRRHVPLAMLAVGLAVLIAAAAKPRRALTVPVRDGAVMLLNDVSASMAARDVKPSRLGAAVRADERFLAAVPPVVRVGLLEFNAAPALLQSPTRERTPVRAALATLRPGGHTYIGDAIVAALAALERLHGPHGRRVPGAEVLLSDGGSNGGVDPLAAAREARARHVPIYTVALGTARGTLAVGRRRVPVPLEPSELRAIASAAGGRSYTVGDAGHLQAVYAHLAAVLGRTRTHHPLTATFAGAGLALALAGGLLSLRWFGRLA
jgi:Ca-activated chloride channel family protein